MTRDDIYSGLTETFHDVFDDDSIVLNDNMTAEDIADWDSQNHINLILATEMRFGIKFRTAELDSMKRVGDLVQIIQDKLNGVAA